MCEFLRPMVALNFALKACCTEMITWMPIRLAEGARRKPLDFVRLFVFFNLA